MGISSPISIFASLLSIARICGLESTFSFPRPAKAFKTAPYLSGFIIAAKAVPAAGVVRILVTSPVIESIFGAIVPG